MSGNVKSSLADYSKWTYTIMAGNPFVGFMYVGPFNSSDAAEKHAKEAGLNEPTIAWWIVRTFAPSKKEVCHD